MRLSSICRIALSFVLTFSLTWGAQGAFAAGSSDASEGASSSASGSTGDMGSSGDSGSSSAQPTTHYVEDIGIYDHDSPRTVYAYATSKAGSAAISSRGGQIDFDALSIWDDGSSEGGYANVTWSVDDASVATIDARSGELTAKANGTVTVTCSTTKSSETNGTTLEAQVNVTITGQDTAPFVTKIVVCGEDGVPIDGSYSFPKGSELATAELDLQAAVTVYDPVAGASTVYQVTPASGLASQTGGELPDLAWSVTVGAFGTVSEEGIYRPSVAATNEVVASSTAGESGAVVTGSVAVIMPDENDNGQGSDAHPQDTLTIEAEWETQPGVIAISKTFTVDDLEALGTSVKAYTALGGGSYMTLTGRGPNLYDVLEAAGVDTSGGVKSLQVKAYDSDFTISWSLLGETGRYFYPNIDIGSYAEAEPVWPMVAIDSKEAVNSCTVYSADELSDATRFRLLFGATQDGGTTTSKQIKWIHTIHIVLAGSPPATNGSSEGTGSGSDDSDSGSSQGGSTSANATSGSGSDSANATVAGEASGQDDASDVTEQADSGAQGTADDTTPASTSKEEAETQDGSANERAWSVLQAVSNNQSIADQLDVENPFEPFALPSAAGLVAAGGVESFVRFRMQVRSPKGVAGK